MKERRKERRRTIGRKQRIKNEGNKEETTQNERKERKNKRMNEGRKERRRTIGKRERIKKMKERTTENDRVGGANEEKEAETTQNEMKEKRIKEERK